MDQRKTLFVDVILPIPIPQLFTYRIPKGMEEQVGFGYRVVVPFGKQKFYTALIRRIHHQPPLQYEAKYIESVLDEQPVTTEEQFRFWEWMSDYYISTIGEVMNSALPGSMKLQSETILLPTGVIPEFFSGLSDRESVLLEELLAKGKLSLKECGEIIQLKSPYPVVRSLMEKGYLSTEEELKDKYKPKMVDFVLPGDQYKNEEAFSSLLNQIESEAKSAKQTDLLLRYLSLSREKGNSFDLIKKKDLLDHPSASPSALKTLIKKGVFQIEQVRIDRMEFSGDQVLPLPTLSEDQKKALDGIIEEFQEKETVLLHGVTGSGKTEVYCHLIQSILEAEENNQVLYLLPEIALTTQIINRLKSFFGDLVGIYHSKFNDRERAETWMNTISGKYRILLGARSSLFLPFKKLGLVIVDEEHETTFKQFDPSPRYHARDSSIILSRIHKAKILLGTATPSIESYYNSKSGRYGLVELSKRYGNILLPEVQCIDLKKEGKQNRLKGIFSDTLIEHIEAAVDAGEQVILFQNRRGYNPYWMCESCNWIPTCRQCDVRLTYHKSSGNLHCHYCGSVYPSPRDCGACGKSDLKMMGAGTEKIEEDLALLNPKIRVARLDTDSVRSKNAYFQILNDFEDGVVDVLVGTQMVTKGLDFSRVSLVGILNADSMLHFPDFRAHERSYQLFAQVAGRAGRKSKRGKVLIQTTQPEHWVIQKVMQNDYTGLYENEILERKNYHYPPFFRLIKVSVRHKDLEETERASKLLAKKLKDQFGHRVLGPEKPYVSRIKNQHIRHLLIKLERGKNFGDLKETFRSVIDDFNSEKENKKIRVDLDVDPY